MKKLILFIATIAILASSCGDKVAFTINGKLPSGEYDGQKVYLQTFDSAWSRDPKTFVTIDTASVMNGQFTFKGLAQDGSAIRFILLDDAPETMRMPVAVIVEPGQIEVKLDSVSTIGGTPSNIAYQSLLTKSNILMTEARALWEKSKDITDDKEQATIEEKLKGYQTENTQNMFDFAKANIQSQIGVYVFLRNAYDFSQDQIKELLSSVKPELKSKVKRIEDRITAQENTAIGKVFTDIKGKTPEGEDIALSDYAGKGKYVLIDFWASWCPPCRAEMPNLVKAYELYKDKGFEIVGFSLDKTNEDWVHGIKNLNITWPQISELKFWDSKPVSDYGVAGIPHLVLLDKEGKIIDRGFSGEELLTKLEELLK